MITQFISGTSLLVQLSGEWKGSLFCTTVEDVLCCGGIKSVLWVLLSPQCLWFPFAELNIFHSFNGILHSTEYAPQYWWFNFTVPMVFMHSTEWYSSTVLNGIHSKVLMVSPTVLMVSPTVLNILNRTEHLLQYSMVYLSSADGIRQSALHLPQY